MAQSAKRTPSLEQPPLTGLEPTPDRPGHLLLVLDDEHAHAGSSFAPGT